MTWTLKKEIKVIKTKKLFYKKFPYRVDLTSHYFDILATMDHERIINLTKGKLERLDYWLDLNQQRRVIDSKDGLIKMINFIRKQDKKTFKVRHERKTISFYFLDETFINVITKKFKELVQRISRPDESELEFLLRNHKVYLTSDLPHDCRYKIYFKPNIDLSNKNNLLNLYKKNKTNIVIPNSVLKWFKGSSNFYNSGLYFYVKDDKTLLLVQIIIGNSITDTYKIYRYDEAKETTNE